MGKEPKGLNQRRRGWQPLQKIAKSVLTQIGSVTDGRTDRIALVYTRRLHSPQVRRKLAFELSAPERLLATTT